MELGLPCIGEPPYYLVQRIAAEDGRRRRGRRRRRSGFRIRNLATPTPEGGE